jgi:hypothetical protein
MAERTDIPQDGSSERRARRAEEVLRAARARPDGLDLLVSAAAECGAIEFGVHPDVVLAARALALARGLSAAAPAEP